ncbi:MAG: DoxX family membrane protein [candidate division Zixibacteria bacterium]|nr:DoxX family membrane protein [candidate division Zixibacteria bacterium]
MSTRAPSASILIRIVVGAVFLSEGIQKFIIPDARGVGRFESIGLPSPEILANFVGAVEIISGSLLMVGLLTRLAAISLIIIMITAIITTKIPILLGHSYWGLNLRDLSSYGFWSMAHASRTDFAMLFGSLYLLIVGSGTISLDYIIKGRTAKPSRKR